MVCDLDADARMTIVMRFISGTLQNLITLFLTFGKQGRHRTGECTICQALRRRGTWRGSIGGLQTLPSCRPPAMKRRTGWRCGAVPCQRATPRAPPNQTRSRNHLVAGTISKICALMARAASSEDVACSAPPILPTSGGTVLLSAKRNRIIAAGARSSGRF